MDLVAGDAREILLAIGTDDLTGLDDPRRFAAHLALGSGLDPTWLDLFAEAARTVSGLEGPSDFIDARLELDGPDDLDGRCIERVDPTWVTAIARIPTAGPRRDRRSLDRARRGRARGCCRATRSPGSAISQADSSPSARPPTVLPTSCSRGRSTERHPRAESRSPVSGHDASFAANRSLWDRWTAIHVAGEFYDLDGFRAGGVRLRPYEIELVGDVAGRSLLHLQCHFGIDTLSWARLGARVTGVDFSPAAIEAAPGARR